MRDKRFIYKKKVYFHLHVFEIGDMNTKYSQLKGGKDSINLFCSEFISDCKFLFVTIIPMGPGVT